MYFSPRSRLAGGDLASRAGMTSAEALEILRSDVAKSAKKKPKSPHDTGKSEKKRVKKKNHLKGDPTRHDDEVQNDKAGKDRKKRRALLEALDSGSLEARVDRLVARDRAKGRAAVDPLLLRSASSFEPGVADLIMIGSARHARGVDHELRAAVESLAPIE